MTATAAPLPRCPKINGSHIAELLESPDALLVQLEDGTVEVTGRELPDAITLRTHKWAADLYATALADALEAGASTAVRTIRATAGRAGSEDLADEHAELVDCWDLEVPARPTVTPAVLVEFAWTVAA